MTEQQKQVRDWMQAFGQECPEKPCVPSLEVRKLRAKLILSEALETIVKGLGIEYFCVESAAYDLRLLMNDVEHYGEFKEEMGGYNGRKGIPSLLEIADGCEDLKVVTEGTLVACGLVTDDNGEKVISQSCDAEGEGDGPQFIHYIGFHDPLFNEVMRSNNSKMWTLVELNEHFQHKIDKTFGKPRPFGGSITTDGFTIFDTKFGSVIENDNTRHWLVKDKDGKVIKSPSYSPANLQPIIDEMSK